MAAGEGGQGGFDRQGTGLKTIAKNLATEAVVVEFEQHLLGEHPGAQRPDPILQVFDEPTQLQSSVAAFK
jgi:hypothetical protein